MSEASSTPSPEAIPADSASNDSVPADSPVEVHPAEFPEMTNSKSSSGQQPLNRFLDVKLQASVELGRAVMSIGDVLNLGSGSVVELDREVTEAVDVFVQGSRLARGEVVIVDDNYAVRITHVESRELPSASPMEESVE